MLAYAPYRASQWRRTEDVETEYSEAVTRWVKLAEDMPLDVQLLTGKVEERAYGMAGTGTHQAFGDHGVSLVAGDGIRIDSDAAGGALVGRCFVVTHGDDWGADGGWQGELEDAREAFEDAP